MEEFKDLMAKLQVEAEKTTELLNEKKVSEAKSMDIVLSNVGIFESQLQEMNDFLSLLRKTTGGDVGFNTDGMNKKVYLDKNNYIFIRPYCNVIVVSYRWIRDTDMYSERELAAKELKCIYDAKDTVPLLEWLGSEEKAQSVFKEYIYPVFRELLSKWEHSLDYTNRKLASYIAELKAKLDDTSVMKETEDGSVEIHLGGKTYTAKLKEE